MAIDYSKFSDEDLEAIQNLDYSKMSDGALRIIEGTDNDYGDASDYKFKARSKGKVTGTTNWLEDIQGSAMNSFGNILSGVRTADVALTSLFGSDEDIEKSVQRVKDVDLVQKAVNPTYGKNRGAGALTTIPFSIAEYVNPFGATASILGQTGQRGLRSVEQGASNSQALQEAGVTAMSGAVGRFLPVAVGSTAKAGAITGGLINAASTPAEALGINALRDKTDLPKEEVPLPTTHPWDYVASVGTGAGVGALIGAGRAKQATIAPQDDIKTDPRARTGPSPEVVNTEQVSRLESAIPNTDKFIETKSAEARAIIKSISELKQVEFSTPRVESIVRDKIAKLYDKLDTVKAEIDDARLENEIRKQELIKRGALQEEGKATEVLPKREEPSTVTLDEIDPSLRSPPEVKPEVLPKEEQAEPTLNFPKIGEESLSNQEKQDLLAEEDSYINAMRDYERTKNPKVSDVNPSQVEQIILDRLGYSIQDYINRKGDNESLETWILRSLEDSYNSHPGNADFVTLEEYKALRLSGKNLSDYLNDRLSESESVNDYLKKTKEKDVTEVKEEAPSIALAKPEVTMDSFLDRTKDVGRLEVNPKLRDDPQLMMEQAKDIQGILDDAFALNHKEGLSEKQKNLVHYRAMFLRKWFEQSTGKTLEDVLGNDRTSPAVASKLDAATLDPDLYQAAAQADVSSPITAIRAMLDHIVGNPEKYGHLSKLAESILSNKLFNPKLDIYLGMDTIRHKTLEVLGLYHGDSHLIELAKKGLNATILMHESNHAITSNVLFLVNDIAKGDVANPALRGLTSVQINAAKGAKALYDFLVKIKVIPDPVVAKRARERFNIANVDELFAYGVTDPVTMQMLQRTPYAGTTALQRLLQLARKMVGMERTAYDELVSLNNKLIKEDQNRTWAEHEQAMGEEGRKVIKAFEENLERDMNAAILPTDPSRPKAEKVNGVWMKGDDTVRIFNAKNWDRILKETVDGTDLSLFDGDPISQQYFGFQQNKGMVDHHPLVSHVIDTIQDALSTSAKLKRNWIGGTQTGIVKKGKWHPVFNLLHDVDEGKAPLLLIENASNKDVLAATKALVDGFNKRRPYADTLAGLPENASKLVEVLGNTYKKMFDDVNLDRERRGMPLLEWREGWVPSIRSGDHMVFVKDSFGSVVHSERFRSKYEADLFVKQLGKDFVPTYIDMKKEAVNPELASLIERELADNLGIDEKVSQKEMGQSLYSTKTQHDKYREGTSGYLGSRWFRTEFEQAIDARKMVSKGIEEFANAHKRAIVNQQTGWLMRELRDKDARTSQNYTRAYSWAKTYIDSALGQHNLMEGPDNTVRNAVDILANNVKKLFTGDKYWYPRISALDRGHGMAAQLFYMSTLTSRPGFWMAQLLSSPQAIRHLFKEDSAISSMASMGNGLLTAFTGGDANFASAVKEIANTRDTFHPQFVNEINEMPGASRQFAGKLKTLTQWATGQKMSAGADSLSRYITFAMMYEHYKKQGFSGSKLAIKAAEATEDTMVMYNMPYKSPLIQNAGLFGQAISPLITFSTAQQGLLVADFKHAKKTGNVKPLIATTLTALAMGGMIGLPLAAEYELLAKLFGLPSLFETMLKTDNTMATLGVPTTVSEQAGKAMGLEDGWDIGSGLRWNQMVSRIAVDGGELMDLVPVIKYATEVGNSLAIIIKYNAGEPIPRGDFRKALMTISPLVGQKGILDHFIFGADDRSMIPQGKASGAFKEQTKADMVGKYLGAQTVAARKEMIRNKSIMDMKKGIKTDTKDSIPAISDALLQRKTENIPEWVLEAVRKDPSINIPSLVKQNIRGQFIDQATRDLLTKNPEIVKKRLELGRP